MYCPVLLGSKGLSTPSNPAPHRPTMTGLRRVWGQPVARTKNRTCSICARPIWAAKGSRPEGQQVCRTCQRSPDYEPRPLRMLTIPRDKTCPTCQHTYTPTGHNQIYCTPHCRPYRSRKSANERGYGRAHQRRRLALTPLVDSGHAECTELICVMPSRHIIPGTPWDLAHDRRTPGAYLGPAHERCNRSEAARYKNGMSKTESQSQRWAL